MKPFSEEILDGLKRAIRHAEGRQRSLQDGELDEQHHRAEEADDPTSDLLPEGVVSADGFIALPIEDRLRYWHDPDGRE